MQLFLHMFVKHEWKTRVSVETETLIFILSVQNTQNKNQGLPIEISRKVPYIQGLFKDSIASQMDRVMLLFPVRGSTQVLLCLFPGVLWLWHFLYSVGPHLVPSLHIYTFVVSRAFMAVAASQAGDADSSRALGLTSGLQGSVNVHRGTLLLVPQWQCISSFVFYIWKHVSIAYHQKCCISVKGGIKSE